MKMKKLIPVIAILGLFMAAHTAQAAAPQLVPVQGVLTDTAGTPIDTSITAVFSLYTTEVGGTALWTETQSLLVEDGLFTAYMGDVTTLDLVTFRDNGNLWLGIQIGSDAEMGRVMLGSNPFAGYAEYCGNIPAVDFGDLTGSVDPADLPSGVVVGALSCSGTQKVSGINTSGALVCSADLDSGATYSAGSGLNLSGTTFSVATGGITSTHVANGTLTYSDTNVNSIQRRVTGTCAAGNSIRAISNTGTVTCEADTDTNTTYSAGTHMLLSGTTFSVKTPRMAASYGSMSLTSGNNFIWGPSAFTAPYSGTCFVVTSATISGSGNTGTGPYFRTARLAGSTSTNDAQFGFYFDPATASYSHMSRSSVWSISAGTSYRFGCFISGASGTWLGDTGYCRTSYMCFYN